MKIMKIGALSAGKIAGVLYAAFGFVVGLIVFVLSLIIGSGSGSDTGIFGGLMAVFILPLLYGSIGTIFAIISAVVFNIVAKPLGGLEIETEK